MLRPPSIETTALGAALAAGLAVGFWTHDEVLGQGDFDSGVDHHPSVNAGMKFTPTVSDAERERRFVSWCKAVERSYNLADLD